MDFADTFKESGIPMSRILVAMCTHILSGNNSMSRCSEWIGNPDVRKGSWIIVDNVGASGDILDSIISSGNKYLTRVNMNASDDLRMAEHGDEWEYVEDGVLCMRHTFESSGRTTYLYFSLDNWLRSYHSAGRNFDRMVEAVRTYEDGKFRKSDFVTVKRNVLADVEVKVSLQTKLGFDETEKEGIIREIMGTRAGVFKLESSEQLTPSEALASTVRGPRWST